MQEAGPQLRVEVLGPLRAFDGGREIGLGAPKQRALFAALAMCADTVLARGELIDRIWGEDVPMTAAGNLHTYVSGLRRSLSGLGDPLVGGSSGYLLRLAPEALDLNRAERLAAQARTARDSGDRQSAIAALDSALALWRGGRPLEALPGPFAGEQRARLASMRLRLLIDRTELMIDADADSDDPGAGNARSADLAAAADELEVHARAHPFDERLRSALMMALHRSGRTADALAQYQMLHRALTDELGIEPEASTRAVQMAILAQEAPTRNSGRIKALFPPSPPTPAPPPTPTPTPIDIADVRPAAPAQLPRDSASFVGRADEVEQVLDYAQADGASASRVVMVVGVGGIGKTTLAVRCAHLLRSAFPDGQIYINLRGYDPTHPALTPSAALHQLLASLGVATVPAEHEQRVALWRSIVAGRRMVVLLDNARSAEQVEDLLPGTDSSFVMVTSRERLGRLAVKYAARRVTLAPLAEDAALGLLADAVGAERVHAEAAAARRLAQLCDHLPFALRIAAEQLVAVSGGCIADLVGLLEDAHQRLDTLRLENDDLCSVRNVMACSFDALDADTARAWRMLGAFPGVSITRYCAAALLDVPLGQASELMGKLSAQHLLEQHGDRYTMHDLTRTYIRELARSLRDDEVRAARDRVSAWYTATLAQMVGEGRRRIVGVEAASRHEPQPFSGQEEFLRWCAQEWPNISALIRNTARSADHLSTWRLTYLLFDYFYATGSAADWLDLLRIAMRSAEASGDRRARAVLLNHMSVAHCRTGRGDVAEADLSQGFDLLDAPDAPDARTAAAARQSPRDAGVGASRVEGIRRGARRGVGGGPSGGGLW